VIVSSDFTVGHAQADGRRYVTERHTFDDGSVEVVEYLADSKADHAAIMAARALVIEGNRIASTEREAEQAAAEGKLQAVLAIAESKGEISREELEMAGVPLKEGVK